LAVATLAVLIVSALVASFYVRVGFPVAASPSPAASATATPSAVVATATAVTTTATTPSPTPPPPSTLLDDRFGFYFYSGPSRSTSKAIVLSETSDAEVSAFFPQDRSFVSVSRAVSPDGRSVAYWSPLSEGAVLHVRSATGDSDRAVFAAAREMSGGPFTWSSDGSAIAVAVDNNCFEICGGPQVAELWTVDLATAATEKVASGKIWLPVAWDRAAQLIAAGVSGPGGYLGGYDVISLSAKPYPVRSFGFPQPPFCCALGLKASTDARYVLLTWPRQEVLWWPVAHPERRSTIPTSKSHAMWRPGTSEIWWVDGGELISFDVSTATRKVALRGRFGATLVGFRIDGSVAIAETEGAPRELVFVDLTSGRTASVLLSVSSGEFGETLRLR
jgi:hypothetical protein